MKKLMVLGLLAVSFMVTASDAFADVRWVNAPSTSNGGYYRDTSNDGNPYNNANYLGYNN